MKRFLLDIGQGCLIWIVILIVATLAIGWFVNTGGGSYSPGQRTGAVCRDGWRSSSTGSGTCSHHGGVDYWITTP
jgi:hypothetical protein